MTLSDILHRLDGVNGHDGQYMSKCPAHHDGKASLSIGVGRDRRVLLRCHAGCDTAKVVAAMGLDMKDLFEPLTAGERFPTYGQPSKQGKDRSPVVATYSYPSGAQKLRRADKSFTWRHPDGKGGWIYNRKGVPVELYRRGDMSGGVVFVAEGEKDANTLYEIGLSPAVSGADEAGPGKWRKEYTEQLRGLHVVVFQDNDDVGKAYAAETCNALHGVAASVRLLDLSKVWTGIQAHNDVSDMVALLGREKAARLLGQLITDTPEWTPAATPVSEPDKLKPALIRACDVPYEPPRWTIAPYFQRGKGTMIQGDNGTGKTAFLCAIAAHVTTGNPLLGMTIADPGDVIILSVEDDLPVLRGRVEASGGDLTRCHFMTNAAGLTFNPDNEDERVMVHVKCSNAPKGRSIAYTIGDRGGVHWVGFSSITAEDLTVITKRKEKGIPYDKEPLVQVFNQLITDKPGGGFWSYEDVRRIGAKLLGFPPFYSTVDLKAKLAGPLVRELQEKDDLIVTCGAKGTHGVRGIKIEQYQIPQGYQTRMIEE